MDVSVAQLFWVIGFQTESDVEFEVEPDLWRIVIFNDHPLPDVEFPTFYQERVLYVLLNDILGLFSERVVKDIVQF